MNRSYKTAFFMDVYMDGFIAGQDKREKLLGARAVAKQASIMKRASAAPSDGYMPVAHQSYMGQYKRRDGLNEADQALMARGQKRIIPKIFKSDSDHPSVDMQDPRWAAGFTGAGTGILGAGVGAAAGGIAGGDESSAAAGAAIGGVTAGLIGALVGYHKRQAKNNDIEDAVRRLPDGATRRDMKADPVYQAERDRAVQLQAARLAAMGGR